MAAFRWAERKDSGDFSRNPDQITLKFACGRTGDEDFVNAYALSATPYIYKQLFRHKLTAKHLGGGMWHVEVPYHERPEPQENEYRIRYDTTGATARVTQAVSHVASYARSGETAPDHGGAINVAPDGRVEGVDRVVSSFKWTEEHTLPIGLAGWSYSQILKALTGHVNANTFRGFSTGQVLFLGATGDYSSNTEHQFETRLTFHFEQQDSISDATYDEITGVTKVGWEYLWYEHGQEDDATANRLKSPLIAVHREVIYETANFGLLQIGS